MIQRQRDRKTGLALLSLLWVSSTARGVEVHKEESNQHRERHLLRQRVLQSVDPVDAMLLDEPERAYLPKKTLMPTISPQPTELSSLSPSIAPSSSSRPTDMPTWAPSTATPTSSPSDGPSFLPSTTAVPTTSTPTQGATEESNSGTTSAPTGTSSPRSAAPSRDIFDSGSTTPPSLAPTHTPTSNIFTGGSGEDGDVDITDAPTQPPTSSMAPSTTPTMSLVPSAAPTFSQAAWEQVEYEFLWDTSDGEAYGSTLSLSDDGNILTVGAFLYNETVTEGGRIVRYDLRQNGVFADLEGEEFSYFGYQTAVSGNANRLAALDSFTGFVEIYDYTALAFQLTTTIDPVFFPLGVAIALSRDGQWLALIGEDQDAQALVNLYQYDGENRDFTQIGDSVLFRSNADSDVWGLFDIAMEDTGRYIAVSQIGVDGAIGQVQVYEVVDSQLVPIGQTFTADEADDAFGQDVEIVVTENSQVLLAFSVPNSDIVYMYSLNSSDDWVAIGDPLVPNFEDPEIMEFGYDITFNQAGDKMMIGAPSFGNRTGAVQQYEDIDGVWIPSGFILSGLQGSFFGQTVACDLDCSLVAVGAPADCLDENTCGGSVYVFRDNSEL